MAPSSNLDAGHRLSNGRSLGNEGLGPSQLIFETPVFSATRASGGMARSN
jgi:hypothetical protein